MKHIKRVKTSTATLLLGDNKIQRIPVVAIFLRAPKGMEVTTWDEQGIGEIPSYEIVDIIPVDTEDNAEDVLVDVVIQQRISEEGTEEEYEALVKERVCITVPIHTVALAQSLSLVNESFNIVAFPTEEFATVNNKAISIQKTLFTLNFPEANREDYGNILDKLSTLIDAKFVEPLYSNSAEVSGFSNIPMPLRRSQMAIMPLISALSQDDVKTLLQVISLESTLDNFHLRNRNQNSETTTGEYAKVLQTMEDLENYVAPEIPEDIAYMSTFEYSILDNMTDAIEEHLKMNEPNFRDKAYYKDITLLILLTNIKATYEKSEMDDFIVNRSLAEEETCYDYGIQLHREFQSIVQEDLTDVFSEVKPEEVEKTEVEKKWAADLAKWNASPNEYWPSSLKKLADFMETNEDSKIYFDIMERSYKTPEEFQALVNQYGLGKVFTSLILKTAINLTKFTDLINENDASTPSPLVATQWISSPDDTYMWELPALSYDLANYDVSTCVSLLSYIRDNFGAYLSIALQGLAYRLYQEQWESTNLEWHLSENSGMPEKYAKILLQLVEAMNEVDIDPNEIDTESENFAQEVGHYVASKGLQEFISNHLTSIDDTAHMIAYAFSSLADIHVNNLPDTSPENQSEGEIPARPPLGSMEWKKLRVIYIEEMLNTIVTNVERKTI